MARGGSSRFGIAAGGSADRGGLNRREMIVGGVAIVAVLAIRLFIAFVQKNGFRVFGWYRIVAGGLLMALILAGKLPS